MPSDTTLLLHLSGTSLLEERGGERQLGKCADLGTKHVLNQWTPFITVNCNVFYRCIGVSIRFPHFLHTT